MGGGVSIYVRNGIQYVEKPLKYDNKLEVIAITILGKKDNITIYNCYANKPSINTLQAYNQIFQDIGDNTIIVGDFNLKHILWNPPLDIRCDTEALNLIDFMFEKKLNCINDGQVTREANQDNHSDSAIDLSFISAHLNPLAQFNVFNNTMGSDHYPILTTIIYKYKYEETIIEEKWKVHKASKQQWDDFRRLCQHELNYDITKDDIENNFQEFLDKLNDILQKTIPKSKPKTVKHKKCVNWWNETCDSAVRKRELARTKYKKDRTKIKKEKWYHLRREAKHILKQAKRDSWIEFCSKITHKTNSKELWDFVKKVKGRPPVINSPFIINDQIIAESEQKANALAQHYQKTSSDENYSRQFIERKTIIDNTIAENLRNNKEEHLEIEFNKDFNMYELNLALDNCKNGAPGDDKIHYKILKNLPEESKTTLLQLFNQSWRDGKTPDSWSKAIIIPLLKPNKDKQNPASYRPISLTSTFTKLMQKMIKPRFCNHLERNNIMSKFQSGCRQNHSCEDNLTRLEADCRQAQIKKEYLVAIFLDLSNAFDKLWNGGALNMLEASGIKGRMLHWLADFLKSRKITVKQNGKYSDILELKNGCPQGSVLSPIIFSLVMNTFEKVIKDHNASIQNPLEHAKISQFVDDSATWVTSKNPKHAITKAQKVLEYIEKWSKEFGFIINPTKTQVLIVHRNRIPAPENQPNFPKLKLCNVELKYNKTAKFLGMHFDKYLSWTQHIEILLQRCQKDCYVLRSIKGKEWGTDKNCLFKIYQSLILSKINYGSIVYATAGESLLKQLQVMQNKALKIVTGTFRHTNTSALLIECAELPLELHREQNMLKYWARSSRQGENLPINELVTPDPAYEFFEKTSKGYKLPYAQKVQKLLIEHNLTTIRIEKPVYQTLIDINTVTPDLSLTEVIKKYNPPEYNKNIALTHINLHYADYYKIYTDGSKTPSDLITGAGIAIYNIENELIKTFSLKLESNLSIYSCELIAISSALLTIKEKIIPLGNKIAIFSDSLSSLQSIKAGASKSRPEIMNSILKDTSEILQTKELQFVWVPSHINIEGNEKADECAKKGSINGLNLIDSYQPSLSEVYSIIKAKIKAKHHKQWKTTEFANKALYTNPPSKLTIYSHNTQYDKIYTRLKLGASCLAAETFRDNKNCTICNVPETFEHVFFECTQHITQRRNLEEEILKLNLKGNIDKVTLLSPPAELANVICTALFKYIKAIGFINKL